MPWRVTIFVRTTACSPSTASPTYWIRSPPLYISILPMYERSSRSAKSCANSSRSAGVRACQCLARERWEISRKSNVS